MDGFAGDHACHRTVLSPDLNVLSDQDLGIPAADGMHPQKSFVINVFDEQPDLVAMSGEHNARRSGWVHGNDDVSMPIGSHFISKTARVPPDDNLHWSFIP